MTEQEIRADERNNMVVRLRVTSMLLMDGPVKNGVDLAIFHILWEVPKAEPDPLTPAHAKSPRAVDLSGVCYGDPKILQRCAPNPAWRNIPVTAGMLFRALGTLDSGGGIITAMGDLENECRAKVIS